MSMSKRHGVLRTHGVSSGVEIICTILSSFSASALHDVGGCMVVADRYPLVKCIQLLVQKKHPPMIHAAE